MNLETSWQKWQNEKPFHDIALYQQLFKTAQALCITDSKNQEEYLKICGSGLIPRHLSCPNCTKEIVVDKDDFLIQSKHENKKFSKKGQPYSHIFQYLINSAFSKSNDHISLIPELQKFFQNAFGETPVDLCGSAAENSELSKTLFGFFPCRP